MNERILNKKVQPTIEATHTGVQHVCCWERSMTDLTSTMSQLTERRSEFDKDVVTALINWGWGDSLKRIKREKIWSRVRLKVAQYSKESVKVWFYLSCRPFFHKNHILNLLNLKLKWKRTGEKQLTIALSSFDKMHSNFSASEWHLWKKWHSCTLIQWQ